MVSEGKALESKPRCRQILRGILRSNKSHGRFFKGATKYSHVGAIAPSWPADPLGRLHVCSHTQIGQNSQNRVETAKPLVRNVGCKVLVRSRQDKTYQQPQVCKHAVAPWSAEGPQDQALTQSTASRHLPRAGWDGSSRYVRCFCFFLMLSPFSHVPASDSCLPSTLARHWDASNWLALLSWAKVQCYELSEPRQPFPAVILRAVQ